MHRLAEIGRLAAQGRGTPPTVAAPFATSLRIGQHVTELQNRLIALGERLADETDADAARLVRDALSALNSQVLRIAVLGQVNAGKTTLTNALARSPGLLPSHSSPWTSVETRVHFGLPGIASPAARFDFFDNEQWQRLAGHGSRLRELAERFLPGFNSRHLEQQISAMRRRAEVRLGDEFARLLGSCHCYESIDPAVVARYVGAEEADPSDGHAGDQPIYSDVTRAANLFLPIGTFGYPTTLIDTPGTNDPFLVREEITLDCIDRCDVGVVVLDATRGVGAADIGLLRILHGVNAERLVVFVNEIDLLPSGSHQAALSDSIASVLHRELGRSDVRITAGSALAAEIALTKFAPFSAEWQHCAERTGLDALETAISDLFGQGPTAHYIRQASSTMIALADASRLAASANCATLRESYEHRRRAAETSERQRKGLARLHEISEQISRTLQQTRQELEVHRQVYIDRASTTLRDLVMRYARRKRDDFTAAYPKALPQGPIRCDTGDLRSLLYVAFAKEYGKSRTDIRNVQRLAVARLRHLLSQVTPGSVEIDFGKLTSANALPSQLPLGRMLAVDLDEPWWQRWLRRRRNPGEAAATLEQLISTEYLRVVDELVETSNEELGRTMECVLFDLSIGTTRAQLVVDGQRHDLATEPDRDTALQPCAASSTNTPVAVTMPADADAETLQHRLEIARNRLERTTHLVHDFKALLDDAMRLSA